MLEPHLACFNKLKIVLASSSPRRIELLQNIGLKFDVYSHDFAEDFVPEEFLTVSSYVTKTACQKNYSVLKAYESSGKSKPDLLIAADTVVSTGSKARPTKDNLFGKPKNEDEAFAILKSLSGRSHSVITGVSFLTNTGPILGEYHFHEETIVSIPDLSEKVIRAYVQTGEPMGKAGAYGIQGKGSTLVQGIKGDYFNVVGFPLHKFCSMLCSLHENNKLSVT